MNRIADVKVSMLTLRVVYRGFESLSDKTKDYKIGNSCFYAKHGAWRRKIKDGLARNQGNVSACGDMSFLHRG